MNATTQRSQPAQRKALSSAPPARRRAPPALAVAVTDLPPPLDELTQPKAPSEPRLVPILDAADDDPWRFGWLDSSFELRRGLCVCEDDAPWGGR